MHIGQSVTYVDRNGACHPASVTAITGAGASGYKQLSLTYSRGAATDVLHVGDVPRLRHCWTLDASTIAPVTPTSEPQPETLTVTEEIPEPPRRKRGVFGKEVED